MSRILVLTTDLPFFPGKNGHDFFNLRHLAGKHQVSIAAPTYDSFPEEGVANLMQFLHSAHLWPNPTETRKAFLPNEPAGRLRSWIAISPRRFRWAALRHILHLKQRPHDAYEKLAVLANLAPQLLEAIATVKPQAILLIQTNLEPWLDYLPAMGGKLFYFHDVRADYLARAISLPGQAEVPRREIAAITLQENQATDRADVVAFVSELDHQRARRLFPVRAESGVAPIPVDTEYYVPAAGDWQKDTRDVVLFTGHLSHPPNVDAVLHFVREIWPLVLEQRPAAVLQLAGISPCVEVQQAAASTKQCELHPNVPDIRPYFWNASVYIVPMRYGGGVRQKLFEAWAMRLPAVCTTMAAEGTGAVDGTHLWLEDTPQAFAQRVASVLQDGEAEQIVNNAKTHVEENNSLEKAAPKFQNLVESAVDLYFQKPFKLLYDLRWMEIGKAGGTEQATYELISGISQLDYRNEYRLYAPRSTCTEWEFPSGFNVKAHYSDPIEQQNEVLQSFLANRLAESLNMPAILNPAMRTLAAFHRMDFNLVHSVCGYTHPDLIDFPNILTINDLQHIHYPEFFSEEEWDERDRLYRESANRAQHIICISEFTRQDVHKQYGIPLDKMSTVWIAPSRNVWQNLTDQQRLSLLATMHLSSDSFLFFPAHCWPHKNHKKLVEAFGKIVSELPKKLKLVFTGRSFPAEHPAAELIRKHGLSDRIVHLGFRSPLEMRALFQGCLGLVFPSLFEGYGMPVAEALIAGKPVACSNVTSLPEIAGDAAITFNPNDAADIGARLVELATQPELRAVLTEAALHRRGLFSARRTAMQTLSVYNRVHQEIYGI